MSTHKHGFSAVLLTLLLLSGLLPGCGDTGTGGTNAAAPLATPPANNVIPGKYLLAFHTRDLTNGFNPGNLNQLVYFAYSNDGSAWTPVPNWTPYTGSVPDIIKRGNTVYFYDPDPDKLTRYDTSTGSVTSAVNVTIQLADGTTDDYGDVSPFLDPSTNKIVIFYKSTKGFNGDPQFGVLPVCSATEIDGSDGTQFLKDSGNRIEPAQHGDCGIFTDGTQFIIYAGVNVTNPGDQPKVLVYTSPTLRGSYTLLSSLPNGVLTNSGSVPDGYFDPVTKKYWTYITTLSPNQPAVIKLAVHSDFSRQLTDADFTTIISNSTYPGLKPTDSPESPGFAVNQ